MASKIKSRRAGRPAGSTNIHYTEAEEIPAACVKCGSTNLTRVPGSKLIERAISGRLPSGLEYALVRWTRKRCECGQCLVVRSYCPPTRI